MGAELICPDCGGRIDGSGKDGYAKCRCVLPDAYAAAQIAVEEPPPEPVSPHAPTELIDAPAEKVCHVCKRDLKGHRRYRDEGAYICPQCKEMKEKGLSADEMDPSRIPCSECGKKLKEGGLSNYNGLKLCRTCLEDRKRIDKFRPNPMHGAKRDEAEKQTVKTIAIVLGVIAAIILLKWMLGL